MTLGVLVLEDEAEVRNGLLRDLEPFMDTVRIEPAEDVEDAWDVVTELHDEGAVLALVLADHRLPGQTGVDFLIELQKKGFKAKSCLVTGQADLEDTVRAVNEADLDHYIAKPWQKAELHTTVRELLTDFVLERGINPMPYARALNPARAYEGMRHYSD